MKNNRVKARKPISEFVNSSGAPAPNSALDLNEVLYLELYEPQAAQIGRRSQPLIDMVKPQPKAFFAYLQMPPKAKSTSKQSTKRISRKKSSSK